MPILLMMKVLQTTLSFLWEGLGWIYFKIRKNLMLALRYTFYPTIILILKI